MSRPIPVWPGPARLTLVLLAAVPAAMAYPWQATRDRWVFGVAVAVVLVLLAWWRGLHLTTMLRRRLAMLRRGEPRGRLSGPDARATAVLRISPPADDAGAGVPLPLIAGYLNRYGISADTVRITSRDTRAGAGAAARETWVSLTVSAAANLDALRARSPRVPLDQTTEVAVRRLADHLRELGWQVSGVGVDEVTAPLAAGAREAWHGVWEGDTGYVAAYQLQLDGALGETLAKIWSRRGPEIWTAVEVAAGPAGPTLSAACALRTAEKPAAAAPVSGLIPEHGHHRVALRALNPCSSARLDGHRGMPTGLLSALHWPAAVESSPRVAV